MVVEMTHVYKLYLIIVLSLKTISENFFKKNLADYLF